jgi:hypothetical protein
MGVVKPCEALNKRKSIMQARKKRNQVCIERESKAIILNIDNKTRELQIKNCKH